MWLCLDELIILRVGFWLTDLWQFGLELLSSDICVRGRTGPSWGINTERAQEAVSSFGNFIQQPQGYLIIRVTCGPGSISLQHSPWFLSLLFYCHSSPLYEPLLSHFLEAKPSLCRMHHNLWANIFWVKLFAALFLS